MAAFNEPTDITGDSKEEYAAGEPEIVKPVDLVHLAKYTMGDTRLESEILALFSKQARIYLGQIEKAETAGEWHNAAHTLKGSAKSIGAWSVADLAAKAEKIDGPGLPDERTEILAEIKAELGEVVDYINRLLES